MMTTTTRRGKTRKPNRRSLRLPVICALPVGSVHAWGSDVAVRLGGDIDVQIAGSHPGIETLYQELHASPHLAPVAGPSSTSGIKAMSVAVLNALQLTDNERQP